MQRHHQAEDDSQRQQQREADRHTCRHNLGQPLVVAASDSVAALVSWLIYECSNTVEQSVIPGGNNDERLADIDTHNCYICKVAQYLASREALLRAFTYALVKSAQHE